MPYISQKQAISNLQRYLRTISYNDVDIPSPPIDGIFESRTRDSLLAFQKKHGLYPSGVGDRETWNKLYEEYLRYEVQNAPPSPLNVFPRVPDGYSLSLGDEYFLVSIIQLLLNELRLIYDSFLPLVTNGIYDESTEANVRDFQSKNLLDVTGKVDKATWDKIVSAYDSYAADYQR